MKFKFRRYYIYYWARCFAFIFYMIPLSVGRYIAVGLGRVTFAVLPKYRRIAIDQLKQVFGDEKSDAEIRRLAQRVFENIAINAIEFLHFPRISSANIDKYVTVENAHFIDDALKKGKGVILLTAHFGNWELLALTVRIKGYPGAAIGRRIYFHKYDEFLNRIRRIGDVQIIYRDQSLKNILKILKKNGIIGMLADQDVDSVEGVFVKFFGRDAYTPVGPAGLAKASGAAIVPGFIIREGTKHRFIFNKPIELADTGDKEADLVTNTQRWSDVVESYIRRYPDHWVWIHRRWKTRPK